MVINSPLGWINKIGPSKVFKFIGCGTISCICGPRVAEYCQSFHEIFSSAYVNHSAKRLRKNFSRVVLAKYIQHLRLVRAARLILGNQLCDYTHTARYITVYSGISTELMIVTKITVVTTTPMKNCFILLTI
jgi:hypothetical protein